MPLLQRWAHLTRQSGIVAQGPSQRALMCCLPDNSAQYLLALCKFLDHIFLSFLSNNACKKGESHLEEQSQCPMTKIKEITGIEKRGRLRGEGKVQIQKHQKMREAERRKGKHDKIINIIDLYL